MGGLEVADLTDHDDVGVLTQYGPQGLGKRQVDFRIHLRLPHTRQLVLNRVFHRHDVLAPRVEPLQRRVQRGGLARTGGPGDQNDAMRLRYQMFEA